MSDDKKCLNCGRVLDKNEHGTRIYCNDLCSHFYRDNKAKKAAIESKLQLEKRKWSTSSIGQLWKFFDTFGHDIQCNLCGKTIDENLDDYGTPLHIQLRNGVNDYRVMDLNSWSIYCTRCFLKINKMKEKSNVSK